MKTKFRIIKKHNLYWVQEYRIDFVGTRGYWRDVTYRTGKNSWWDCWCGNNVDWGVFPTFEEANSLMMKLAEESKVEIIKEVTIIKA